MSDEGRLAGAVRSRRKELMLSQAELAIAAEVSESTIRALESGRRTSFRSGNKRSLAEALGWTPDSIERILTGDPPIALDSADGQVGQKGATDRDAWVIEQLADINRKLDAIQAALRIQEPTKPATAEDIERHTLAKINESLSRPSGDHPPTTDVDQESA